MHYFRSILFLGLYLASILGSNNTTDFGNNNLDTGECSEDANGMDSQQVLISSNQLGNSDPDVGERGDVNPCSEGANGLDSQQVLISSNQLGNSDPDVGERGDVNPCSEDANGLDSQQILISSNQLGNNYSNNSNNSDKTNGKTNKTHTGCKCSGCTIF
ncbi:hypothetical protein TCON_1123 [Astathelohania contejeani]|uniref:Secreted protein n=1 Tax=Astathelohania contejeani TaxID=164912 RepID=A0ABQ7HZU1_9MICR|nr:hypothetical protein TCON_1123 [Thelohania contejeani]